jgi:hypothetical protein
MYLFLKQDKCQIVKVRGLVFFSIITFQLYFTQKDNFYDEILNFKNNYFSNL